MYERHFGFTELPFRLTPDPKYLFLSRKHREALGHLVFGIREGAGFVAITGEIGAGKTTLLRALLRETDDTIDYAYIHNPVLSGLELLQEINSELGLPTDGERRNLAAALNQHLLGQKAVGRRVVVVVDEAQALDGTILEQLRLLSNLETETAKLLQIVLVGQPELRDILARPELAQLNQRVTVRWHLLPLDREEAGAYVAHRVATASGGVARDIFTAGAIREIYAYSKGVPRLVNIACHRALLVAYAAGAARVSPKLARQAVAELRLHEPGRRVPRRTAWLAAAAAAGVAVATTVLLMREFSHPSADERRLASEGAAPEAAAVRDPGRDSDAGGRVAERARVIAPPGGGDPAPAPVAAQAPAVVPPSVPIAAPVAAASNSDAVGGPVAPVPTPDVATATGEVATAASSGAGATRTDDTLPAAAATPAGVEQMVVVAGTPAVAAAPIATPLPGEAAVAEAAPPDLDRAILFEALAQTTPSSSAYDATQALLGRWNAAPLTAAEASSPVIDLPRVARTRGLEYLSFQGNLSLLKVLDLPAILELIPEDGGPARFSALEALDDREARLTIGRSMTAVSPPVLGEAWFGRAHVLWRDFDHIGSVLQTGATGVAVTRLHGLLQGARIYDGPRGTVFAGVTEDAVMRFQRARRLTADGKVGPLTLIALYRASEGYPAPSLIPEGGGDPPAPAVAPPPPGRAAGGGVEPAGAPDGTRGGGRT